MDKKIAIDLIFKLINNIKFNPIRTKNIFEILNKIIGDYEKNNIMINFYNIMLITFDEIYPIDIKSEIIKFHNIHSLFDLFNICITNFENFEIKNNIKKLDESNFLILFIIKILKYYYSYEEIEKIIFKNSNYPRIIFYDLPIVNKKKINYFNKHFSKSNLYNEDILRSVLIKDISMDVIKDHLIGKDFTNFFENFIYKNYGNKVFGNFDKTFLMPMYLYYNKIYEIKYDKYDYHFEMKINNVYKKLNTIDKLNSYINIISLFYNSCYYKNLQFLNQYDRLNDSEKHDEIIFDYVILRINNANIKINDCEKNLIKFYQNSYNMEIINKIKLPKFKYIIKLFYLLTYDENNLKSILI